MLHDAEGRNGRPAKTYPEEKLAVMMTVYTKAPTKWLLVDRETGESYQGNRLGSWDRMEPYIDEKKRARNGKRI